MEIQVKIPTKQYPVFVGREALSHLEKFLIKMDCTKVLMITDETVGQLHESTIINFIPESLESAVYHVPSGESAKQFSVYEKCLTYALEFGLDRKSIIIAFGGGAVGDLAGFVAATYMRGVRFIQVPTTILAHDSAVGGKTGINHPLGKNMIGAFHQPEGVFYNTDFLHTLPISEKRSGFAEAVKHAFIADHQFLTFLMEEITDLNTISDENLKYILTRGIEIKADVVSKDEKEMGLRAVLNLGHTLGHVLESTAGYGKLTHGEAVMTGLVYALYLSKNTLHFNFNVTEFEEWLNKVGYKLEIPEPFDIHSMIKGMKRDKKSFGQKARFVLLEEIGSPVVQEVEDTILIETFKEFIESTKLTRN